MACNAVSRRAPRLGSAAAVAGCLLAIALGTGPAATWAQAPAPDATRPAPTATRPAPAATSTAPAATATAAAPDVVVSRNLLAGQASRPDTKLEPGGTLSLAAQRVHVADIQRLRVEAPDPEVAVALRFRRLPAARDLWALTVILVTRPRPHDYLYRSAGEQVSGGQFAPQASYRVGTGLETELTPAGGAVAEIAVQDEGDAEIRLHRQDGTLVLTVVPPGAGGHPTGAPRPWYRDDPLRFLDYQVLLGGYAKAVFANDTANWLLPAGTPEHAFLEANVRDAAGVRAAWFTRAHESFSVEQLVFTLQPVRGEWWSLWTEAGASAFQRTQTPLHGKNTAQSGVGWTAGAAAHARFGDWGATVRWADTDGPSLTQALAGWQATRHVGVALSWLSYRNASATGLALSVGF